MLDFKCLVLHQETECHFLITWDTDPQNEQCLFENEKYLSENEKYISENEKYLLYHMGHCTAPEKRNIFLKTASFLSGVRFMGPDLSK